MVSINALWSSRTMFIIISVLIGLATAACGGGEGTGVLLLWPNRYPAAAVATVAGSISKKNFVTNCDILAGIETVPSRANQSRR